MKYVPLNFDLLRNPFNWLIVALMVMIFGMATHLIVSTIRANVSPADKE